jgi:starch phosphorylase
MTNSRTTTVAYFSMEACLESAMPTYSGGLGVLAGDTLRASADLGLPMVGVMLLYRQGFFRQHLDATGVQSESAQDWDPSTRLRPVDVKVYIEIEGRRVAVTAWEYHVRGVRGYTEPVYLLDTDLPENDAADRRLTGQLYGGDRRYRLHQEVVLGLGGVALLRALGYDRIETFHMNEGHCSFLTLALLEEASRDPARLGDPDAVEAVRRRCVFTTHTPVSAGHDRFPIGLVQEVVASRYTEALTRLAIADETLNMTRLGMFFARYINAVARRHAETARAMHPDQRINSVTNGVHVPTWASEPMAELFDREIPQWRYDNHSLRQALMMPVEEIQEAHAHAKRDLLAEIERRNGVQLDPAVLTIGFARRAATYKRADLVFRDLGRLEAIANDGWPLQFVFAGKAHPNDESGKALIRRVFEARDRLKGKIDVVYLENHDMALGRLLCSGVDLWLNNPQKPQEASGTSGMKAALNGVPSLSVLDGWWPEGWVEGVTGWSIGESFTEPSDDALEAESLYYKLRYVIIPLFYGSATGFARVMRSTIALNGSYFTAQRMIEQYVANAYESRPEGRSVPVPV